MAIAIIVAKKGCDATIVLLNDTPTLSNPRNLKCLPNAAPNKPLKIKNKTAELSKCIGEKKSADTAQKITKLTDKVINTPDRLSTSFNPFFSKIEDTAHRIAANNAKAEVTTMIHHHEMRQMRKRECILILRL